jgi:hypothetical protein
LPGEAEACIEADTENVRGQQWSEEDSLHLAGAAAEDGDSTAITAASPLAEHLAAGSKVGHMASQRYTAEDMLAADGADEAADVLLAALQHFGSGPVRSRVG